MVRANVGGFLKVLPSGQSIPEWNIYRGVEMTLKEAIIAGGNVINISGARQGIKNGWNVEEAMETRNLRNGCSRSP